MAKAGMASLHRNFAAAKRAVIIGSSGGIGSALARQLAEDGFGVACLSRPRGRIGDQGEVSIDITNESSVAEAAARLADQGPYIIILVATGLLHDDKIAPEKTYRVLSQSTLQTYFAVNSIGPALVAKHFIPLLPKTGRCVFAALSARVGSIADNRLGGWYGYRASKAALNMLIKTLAIEVGRTRPGAICVGLHPGTVDTNLSKPFQPSVAPERLFMADDAARQLVNVFGNLTPADSGGCFSWNGERILP